MISPSLSHSLYSLFRAGRRGVRVFCAGGGEGRRFTLTGSHIKYPTHTAWLEQGYDWYQLDMNVLNQFFCYQKYICIKVHPKILQLYRRKLWPSVVYSFLISLIFSELLFIKWFIPFIPVLKWNLHLILVLKGVIYIKGPAQHDLLWNVLKTPCSLTWN